MDFTPEERQHYIGGSDISAIMNLNPWKTIHDVFIEKVDDPKPFKENEAMYWGKALEESIADRWLMERHKENYNIERSQVLSTGHPTKDYIRGHPDAIYKGWRNDKPITCFLEVKTTDARNSSNWTHTAPPYYFVQLAWYAMINAKNYEHRGESLPETEYWFAVLIGGNKYKELIVDINQSDIGLVESKGTEFWEEHVSKKIMPEYSEPDENINKFLFPHVSDGEVLECDQFVAEKVKEYRNIKESTKKLYSREKELKEFIKNKMGRFQYLTYNNEKIATQSEYNRVSIDWEEVAKNYQKDHNFYDYVKHHTKSTTTKSLR